MSRCFYCKQVRSPNKQVGHFYHKNYNTGFLPNTSSIVSSLISPKFN